MNEEERSAQLWEILEQVRAGKEVDNVDVELQGAVEIAEQLSWWHAEHSIPADVSARLSARVQAKAAEMTREAQQMEALQFKNRMTQAHQMETAVERVAEPTGRPSLNGAQQHIGKKQERASVAESWLVRVGQWVTGSGLVQSRYPVIAVILILLFVGFSALFGRLGGRQVTVDNHDEEALAVVPFPNGVIRLGAADFAGVVWNETFVFPESAETVAFYIDHPEIKGEKLLLGEFPTYSAAEGWALLRADKLREGQYMAWMKGGTAVGLGQLTLTDVRLIEKKIEIQYYPIWQYTALRPDGAEVTVLIMALR